MSAAIVDSSLLLAIMAGFKKPDFRQKAEAIKKEVRNDETLNRAQRYAYVGFRKFPSVAGEYFYEKLPVIQWLPRYQPKWLLNDLIAGLTVGVMLIPQSLAYAKVRFSRRCAHARH